MQIKTMFMAIVTGVFLAITTAVIARNSLTNHDNININEQSVKINTDQVNIDYRNNSRHGERIVNRNDITKQQETIIDVDSRNNSRHGERRVNRNDIAQQQETSININSEDLKLPHLLIINSDTQNRRLSVQIKLNGQFLRSITKSTEINISPLLKKGRNIINISGEYNPENALIKVRLLSDSTQIDQESSGNGILSQTLVIFVR